MSIYREKTNPSGAEDFIGKYVKIICQNDNAWYGILKSVRKPSDSQPYWEFHIKIKGKYQLVFISKNHNFALLEC